MKHLPIAGALAFALFTAGAAHAAATAQPNVKTPSYAAPVVADANAMKGADELHQTNLRQQLHDQLAKAGYTAIKITPSSFYVQAKDKKGDSVAMVIGPDSFTEVTEIASKTPAATAQSTPQTSQTPAQQK